MSDGHDLGMQLRKAYLTFHRRANALTSRYGVTADQFVLLTVLAREEGLTQVAIVERTASDPNTVAAVLRLLERRGLVRREPHADDRRARCVFLTTAGRRTLKLATRATAPLLSQLSEIRKGTNPDVVDQFLRQSHAALSDAADSMIDRDAPSRDGKKRKGATRK